MNKSSNGRANQRKRFRKWAKLGIEILSNMVVKLIHKKDIFKREQEVDIGDIIQNYLF